MAIKPISFNSKMVRAILGGHKTVTRRVVKGLENYDDFCVLGTDHGLWAIFDWRFRDGLIHSRIARAPYEPGDVLWVREPWNYGFFDGIDREIENSRRFEPLPIGYDLNTATSHIVHEFFVYRADGCAYGTEKEKGELVPMTWRLPIHMPRDAARIWLRVTNVRVERRYGWKDNPLVWVIDFERCEKPEQ